MADIKLAGNPCQTSGTLPQTGSKAPDFRLVRNDLSLTSLADYEGKRLIMNIFPSIDTDVCAASTREFNKRAGGLENTVVACISRDLPFAQKRFCAAEGIENVITLSDFQSAQFGKDYGLVITGGPLSGLHSRAVIVVDETGQVVHSEQVPDIVQEPDYEAALGVLT